MSQNAFSFVVTYSIPNLPAKTSEQIASKVRLTKKHPSCGYQSMLRRGGTSSITHPKVELFNTTFTLRHLRSLARTRPSTRTWTLGHLCLLIRAIIDSYWRFATGTNMQGQDTDDLFQFSFYGGHFLGTLVSKLYKGRCLEEPGTSQNWMASIFYMSLQLRPVEE